MHLNKTYNYLSAMIELGPGWVLVIAIGLFSTFKFFCLIIPLFVIQKTSITPVVVEPIIYRKKFTVFQRGAVNCL